jgi:hypothetical protein
MKNLYLGTVLTLSVLLSHGIQAQVGIGTTVPAASSVLDLTSANSGLLIPRVTLTSTADVATIASPATSLLVYNTATAGVSPNNVIPGYYYWNTTKWVQLSTGTNSDWSLLGNAGTVAGTNFIGTTDGQDIRFKTQSTDRWNISNANNGQLQSYSLGTNALPTYSFQGDQNTGWYSSGADVLDLTTGGTARFRIPAANQVHALSLGTNALPFYSFSADTDTGVYSPLADNLSFSTAATERLRVEADGDVGIGVTPNASAKLDITATNRGLLIPRVALTATTDVVTIASPVTSLLVYNTATAGAGATAVSPGFYYYSAGWVKLATGTNNDWSLTGNAGTTGTNYVGTSDGVALKLATTGAERIRILSGGQVVVNNTAAPAAADRFSVYNTTTSDTAIRGYSTLTGFGVVGDNVGTGRGVLGFSTSTGTGAQGQNSGTGAGVAGFSVSTGYGVYGQNTATGRGVIGFSASTGTGVQGQNSATGAGTAGFSVSTGVGAYGQNTSTGVGIMAVNTSSGDAVEVFQDGNGDGIYTEITDGTGIYNNILNTNYGIYNDLTSAGGIAYMADLGSSAGNGYEFENTGADGFGFIGAVTTLTPSTTVVSGAVLVGTQTGPGHGVLINHSGTQGRNAEFNITNASNTSPAIFAVTLGRGSAITAQNQNNTIPGAPISVANFAYTGTDSDDHVGVYGNSAPAAGKGVGVEGVGNLYGVHGTGGTYGVFSTGDFGGTGAKYFVIDHPLDPANKYLRHANIESNEILNFYRGTAIFGADGKASIQLPAYYDAINKNASYQLTPVGAAMPNLFVEKEIEHGIFVIAGGVPGKKVSWNVTAERNDPYLQQNPDRRENEIDKGDRRGKYLTPELYGQPKEAGISYREEIKAQTTAIPAQKELTKRDKKALKRKKLQADIESENIKAVPATTEQSDTVK